MEGRPEGERKGGTEPRRELLRDAGVGGIGKTWRRMGKGVGSELKGGRKVGMKGGRKVGIKGGRKEERKLGTGEGKQGRKGGGSLLFSDWAWASGGSEGAGGVRLVSGGEEGVGR